MTLRTAFVLNGKAGGGCDEAWLAENRQAIEAAAGGSPIILVENGELDWWLRYDFPCRKARREAP